MTAARASTSTGLVYERRGDGPTVVFLHGWCLHGRLWTYQEAALLDRYQVVIPDLAGFGRSDGLVGPFSLTRHADDVARLLDEADLRDVTVVGFAYGGAVAMHAARAHPSRIARIAVIGVPKAGITPDERMLRSMQRDWPGYGRRSAEAICTRPQSEATIDWLESMFVGTRLAVALETWRDISAFEPVPVASELGVPALFIHGADDEFTPASAAEEAARAASAGRTAIAEECGHMVMLEQPQWFQETLERFLAESA
jgi:pimeloyl-ACP methyl ester carboxylesterase